MRLLHTSDWHLGRSFHGEGMLEHQATFVDHLLEVVEAERIDLVLLAGDVYDRALPPVDAVKLADDAFARLAHSGARVVVTSGNHDSARRLGFNSRLIDGSGVHFRTDVDTVGTPVLLDDEHGPVAVHGLPYLEPEAVREPWGLDERSHHSALSEAMRRVRLDLDARSPGTRSVVLAHAFVAGGQASESERNISVGGVSRVPTSIFDGIDYVALGHLHGRHTLTEHIRYSGSPLAYSFSEAGHRKGSWLVELGADGLASTRFVDAPVPRPLACLRGELESLLGDPAHDHAQGAWLQVTLTDAIRPADPMARLRKRFPHTLVIGFDPVGAPPVTLPGAAAVRGRSDHQIALDFVGQMRGAPASPSESDLLRDACEACCTDDRQLDQVASAPAPGGAS